MMLYFDVFHFHFLRIIGLYTVVSCTYGTVVVYFRYNCLQQMLKVALNVHSPI